MEDVSKWKHTLILNLFTQNVMKCHHVKIRDALSWEVYAIAGLNNDIALSLHYVRTAG